MQTMNPDYEAVLARQQADEEEVRLLKEQLRAAERRLDEIEAYRRRETDYRRLRAEAEARLRGEYLPA